MLFRSGHAGLDPGAGDGYLLVAAVVGDLGDMAALGGRIFFGGIRFPDFRQHAGLLSGFRPSIPRPATGLQSADCVAENLTGYSAGTVTGGAGGDRARIDIA